LTQQLYNSKMLIVVEAKGERWVSIKKCCAFCSYVHKLNFFLKKFINKKLFSFWRLNFVHTTIHIFAWMKN
jgi:uncharacterized Fe-S cluster-containing MiaB family protein